MQHRQHRYCLECAQTPRLVVVVVVVVVAAALLSLVSIVMGRPPFVDIAASLYLTKPPKPTQPGHPSMGRCSTGDDYGHRQVRNGEFYITVSPVILTIGIFTLLVEGAAVNLGCMLV